MDRLNLSLFFLWMVVFCQTGNAQTKAASDKLQEEIINISASDELYVSGSNLYFQILATNKDYTPSDISKVAEVGLFDSKGKRLAIQKVLLKDGIGSGKFFIESDVPSGEFSLIAATSWSMNNRNHSRFAEKEIILLNPFQKLPSINTEDTILVNYKALDLGVLKKEIKNPKDISVSTDKERYGLREKVELTIENDIAFQAPFTISVERLKPLEIERSQNTLEVALDAEQVFVPTIRGSLVQGTIAAKGEALDVANKTVALSIPGKHYVFKLDRTNSKGEFLFALDEGEYSYRDINVYVVGDNKNDFEVRLNKSILDFIHPEKKVSHLKLDPALKDWLEFESTANQIENAYFTSKSDSISFPPVKDHFYAPLGIEYKLDDYTRFATVNETFIEVISTAALRKEGGNYNFKVYNYEDEKVKIPGMADLAPMVLIDGILLNDNAELVGYNPREIEKITVVIGNYRYGSKMFAGIIDVETREGNYGDRSRLIDYQYLYPQLDGSFYQPDYSQAENLSNIPDYRTQLFWDFHLNLQERSSVKEEFYTSDLEGLYKVEVKGLTKNGEEINSLHYFIVEP